MTRRERELADDREVMQSIRRNTIPNHAGAEQDLARVLSLPKWHPARFLALYGAGPKTVGRAVTEDEAREQMRRFFP